ncbi:MAG: hypothetical protein WBZ04_05680 [Candidatus Nanopelagicales bacterium]
MNPKRKLTIILALAVPLTGLALTAPATATEPTSAGPETARVVSLQVKSTLDEGEDLDRGSQIVSANGQYRMEFRNFGYFSLSGPSGEIWRSPDLLGATHAGLLPDGDLAIRQVQTKEEWRSGTAAKKTAQTGPLQVLVTDDGQVQIRGTKNQQVLWANGEMHPEFLESVAARRDSDDRVVLDAVNPSKRLPLKLSVTGYSAQNVAVTPTTKHTLKASYWGPFTRVAQSPKLANIHYLTVTDLDSGESRNVYLRGKEVAQLDSKNRQLGTGDIMRAPDGKASMRLVQRNDNSVYLRIESGSGIREMALGKHTVPYLQLMANGDIWCGVPDPSWRSDTAHRQNDETGKLFLRLTANGDVQIVGERNGLVVWQNGDHLLDATAAPESHVGR